MADIESLEMGDINIGRFLELIVRYMALDDVRFRGHWHRVEDVTTDRLSSGALCEGHPYCKALLAIQN